MCNLTTSLLVFWSFPTVLFVNINRKNPILSCQFYITLSNFEHVNVTCPIFFIRSELNTMIQLNVITNSKVVMQILTNLINTKLCENCK